MSLFTCKRAGLYEQGKLLYEKGGLNPDNLPEEVRVNAEEDDQVCARMLARDEGKTQGYKRITEMNKAKGKMDQSDRRRYSAERKRLLDQEMNRCVRMLTEHGSPEKVILFGTLAKGEVHEWSDIDLVVVERTQLPFFQRIRKVRKLLQPKVGMDIMVYTPEEFDQLCADRSFFREEIIGKGEIVYERAR